MKVTPAERLMLINQYRILEKLVPDEAAAYAEMRNALERGFTLAYEGLTRNIDKHEMTEDECKEVINIVDMYRHLKESYDALPDKTKVDASSVEFPGFDGNDEAESGYASYVRHMVEHEGRWAELRNREGDFNSHCPMSDKYAGMLTAHSKFNRLKSLTKEEILEVVNAPPVRGAQF